MDLRGIAKTQNKIFIAGGMTNNQTVTNSVFSFVFDESFVSIDDVNLNKIKIFPNPVFDKLVIEMENIKLTKVYDCNLNHLKSISYKNVIDFSDVENGIYFLEIFDENDKKHLTKIIKQL